jgi:hypothetical protein
MKSGFLVAALVLTTVTSAAAQTDGLECFKIKGLRQRARIASLVHNPSLPSGCTIKLPAKLVCARPATSGSETASEAGLVVCSEVKCRDGAPPPSAVVRQVLRAANVRRLARIQGKRLVCSPLDTDDGNGGSTTTTLPNGQTTTTRPSTTATTTTTIPPFPTCSAPGTACGHCGDGACKPTRPEGYFACTFQTQGFCGGSCSSSADCSDGKICVGASGEFGQCCTVCE